MQTTAIISGLIGALLSAFFSYLIRLKLDRHSLLEAERRLAYVYFVRASDLVAIDLVVRSTINAFLPEQVRTGLSSTTGSFEPSHKLSVIIAEELCKLTPEKLREIPGLSTIPISLKSLLESADESKLTNEQLSKLPQEAVLTYSFFLRYLAQVRSILALWILFFEGNDAVPFTAENIHDQWTAVAHFFSHAKELRRALILSGAATPEQAALLIKKQVDAYNAIVLSKSVQATKLNSALAEITASLAAKQPSPS